MYPPTERFCLSCGIPLVPVEEPPAPDPARERARKVDPAYTQGPLVQVAFAQNQAEAEMIQGLLLEEGIPSMLRRSRGFDVPDYLAAGPRDVLAPASAAEAARDVLRAADLGAAAMRPGAGMPPLRQRLVIALAVLAGGALAAAIARLLIEAAA